MTPKTLRVRPRGDALVQDHERLEVGVNAFIGRRFIEVPDAPGTYGFMPTGEDATVPYRGEYFKALKDGDLVPADEATAKFVGLEFKPSAPTRPSFSPAKNDDSKDGAR